MEFLNLVWEYKFIIVMVLYIVLYAFFEWEKFKIKAYAVMLQAKKMTKYEIIKSGEQQEEWVVKRLYQLMPKACVRFVSEDNMRKVVHWMYRKAKDYLDDSKLNGSI